MTKQKKNQYICFSVIGQILILCIVLNIQIVQGISSDFGSYSRSIFSDNETQLSNDDLVKIFDGSISFNSFPFMVAIVVPGDEPQLICGASLVDEDHILTAGHCVDTIQETLDKNELLEAWIGVQNLKNFSGPKIPVTKVTGHPDFKPRPILHNDIAIANLKYPVSVTTDQNLSRVICIGTNGDYDQFNVTLIGFGNYDCFNVSTQLRIAKGQAMNNSVCQTRGHKKKILNSQLCAELENPEHRRAEQAPGDSGGPLFFQMHDGNFVQVGSVSYNYIRNGKKDSEGNPLDPCPNLHIPGVYTKVGAHKNFIRNHAPKVQFCN